MKKQVKAGLSPSPTKTPQAELFPDFNRLHPAWRIARLEMSGPFGWHEIEKDKLDDIRRRLLELENLTWNEILVGRKHWNHAVSTVKLCKEARDRLTELNLDDRDELISLRLSNRERIWGYKLEGAMTLLWWDPNHDVWQD